MISQVLLKSQLHLRAQILPCFFMAQLTLEALFSVAKRTVQRWFSVGAPLVQGPPGLSEAIQMESAQQLLGKPMELETGWVSSLWAAERLFWLKMKSQTSCIRPHWWCCWIQLGSVTNLRWRAHRQRAEGELIYLSQKNVKRKRIYEGNLHDFANFLLDRSQKLVASNCCW